MKVKDLLEMADTDFESKEGEEYSISDYMNSMGESGKEIILNKMKEYDFVRVSNIVRSALLAGLIYQGEGSELMLSEISGNLKTYTDTIVLCMIGILADEEVI